MRILLDTQAWLWWLARPESLADEARRLLTSRRNEILISAVSSWEITIKVGLGKLTLPSPPKEYVPGRLQRDGFSALPIQHVHALQVAELPALHRDPFDRLLVAQAQVEDLPLMTADAQLARYRVRILWAGRPGGGPA